jgi:predicted Fe-S protein YdhL (DUF1289 family)
MVGVLVKVWLRKKNNMTDKVVKSPCISVCMLNNEDICTGCYRSASEITNWTKLSNQQKQEIMESVRARYKSMNHLQLL